jgi:hypothetical protein
MDLPVAAATIALTLASASHLASTALATPRAASGGDGLTRGRRRQSRPCARCAGSSTASRRVACARAGLAKIPMIV